jgi:hypothetical protein
MPRRHQDYLQKQCWLSVTHGATLTFTVENNNKLLLICETSILLYNLFFSLFYTLKMPKPINPERQNEAIQFITSVTGESVGDLHESLKSGVILCK